MGADTGFQDESGGGGGGGGGGGKVIGEGGKGTSCSAMVWGTTASSSIVIWS